MRPAPDCAPFSERLPPDPRPGLLARLEVRLDPETAGWADGDPGGSARMRGYARLVDGTQPDPLMLLLAADALGPTSFELGTFGWVPTVEMTTIIRAVPAPGWLRLVVASQLVDGGWLDEEIEVWDSADRLVAQGRQLARLRTDPRIHPVTDQGPDLEP
jgi:hypothetical protein